MKKLLLLLLLPLTMFAQSPVVREYFNTIGKPTSSGQTKNDKSVDFVNKKIYNWTGTLWIEIADTNLKKMYFGGSEGTSSKDATVQVGSVQTITGAPGSSAQVQITDANPSASDATLNFNFTIPAGQTGATGPAGPPGSGGSGSFPFTIVVASGGDDRGALQMAINKNSTDNLPVYLIGNLKTSGEIQVNKSNYKLTIISTGASLISTNSNPFTFFKRTTPADNSDANIYIVAQFVIQGGYFQGKSNQNLFDLGPSYMSHYYDFEADGFNEVLHLRFALNTTVENVEAVNCLNPFIADIGNWTGASNSNSQSNHSSFVHCRCYMPNGGGQAFLIFASSGCSIRDCIIEGGSVTNGIYWDTNNSSVVKDGTIENVHFECVNGASNAFIKVNLGAGTVTINKCYGQYPAIFLDAYSLSGLGFVQTSNVPYWVGKASKFFRTSNITLDFKYNEAFRGINSSYWEGTAPSLCTGQGCGYNKYTYQDIPR